MILEQKIEKISKLPVILTAVQPKKKIRKSTNPWLQWRKYVSKKKYELINIFFKVLLYETLYS